QMYTYGLLGDLVPELSEFIKKDGGVRSSTFKYLRVLDEYTKMMEEKGFEVSNGLRMAVLMTSMFRAEKPAEGVYPSRRVMQILLQSLKIPKSSYFTAVTLLESMRRLSLPPSKGKRRFIHNRDFLDALDYNRIVLKAEKRSEKILNEWSDLYEEKGVTNEPKEES
ncbi:MAG: hypothetical protein J6R80_00160, partial [Kiritimatiellae bacterium]|nr:hypothetical protein [Kiritimatiellia bacterium]